MTNTNLTNGEIDERELDFVSGAVAASASAWVVSVNVTPSFSAPLVVDPAHAEPMSIYQAPKLPAAYR